MNAQDFETDLYKKSGGKYFRLLLSTLAKKIRMASGLTLEAAFSALGLKVDGNTAEIAQAKGQLSTHMADLDAHGLASVKSGLAVTRDAVISAQELANAAEDAAQANAAVIEELLQKVAALEAAIKNGGYNREEFITASGNWTAKATAWYEVLIVDGGNGGLANTSPAAWPGASGNRGEGLVFLTKGQVVPVTIGAGGKRMLNFAHSGDIFRGGFSSFNGLSAASFNPPGTLRNLPRIYGYDKPAGANVTCMFSGSGEGGGAPGYWTADQEAEGIAAHSGRWYGAGGAATATTDTTYVSQMAGDGYPGCVRLRWHELEEEEESDG